MTNILDTNENDIILQKESLDDPVDADDIKYG